MSTMRRAARPEGNFYILDKAISEDTDLSWAARGMLIYLLGKPDNWEVSVQNLINQTQKARTKSGRDAVRALIKELAAAGYIRKFIVQGEDGKFAGHDYEVSEMKQKPKTDSPAPDQPKAANPQQISIEVLTRIEEDQSSSNQKNPDCPHQTLIDMFAEQVPSLPKPRAWTSKRQKDMLARWKWVIAEQVKDKDNAKQEATEFFGRFFDYVNRSDFLTGRSGAWTKCDLPWLMKEENFAKVIEGNYENNKGN